MGRYSKDPNEVAWNAEFPVVPFIDGEMQGTTFSWSENVEWTPVDPVFKSAMEIVRWERNNSTVVCNLRGDDGRVYRTSLWDITDIMENSVVDHDRIPEHTWRFCKKGSMYLIKLEA